MRLTIGICEESALHRLTTSQTPLLRRSNPHSQRGLITRSPSAVSSLGGFRTPAHSPRRLTHWAGIRKPFTQAAVSNRSKK